MAELRDDCKQSRHQNAIKHTLKYDMAELWSARNQPWQSACCCYSWGWKSPKQSHKCLWGLKLAVAVISVKGGVERTVFYIRSAKQCFQKQHLQMGSKKKKMLDFTSECWMITLTSANYQNNQRESQATT